MDKSEIVSKKAELINHGKINLAKGFSLPFYPSRSTAGPGAGRQGLVLGFYGTRVKLSIVRDGSAKFTLIRKDSSNNSEKTQRRCIQGAGYSIKQNDSIFIDNVSLEPTLMHAPGQAFINLTSECIYDCSFCATPEMDNKNRSPTPERWLELILNHANNRSLGAVAITSGVAGSPHNTVLDMVKVITGVRTKLPEIPIGVEPYVTSEKDIELLYKASANEIKINLETPNREIFDKICKGLDYEGLEQALDHAVSIFGKNNVCSNLIVGLGETDAELLAKVEELASRGIVATLRGVRVNELNQDKLKDALGFSPEPVEPERLIKLAEKQKGILDNYGLSTTKFKTMCHKCKCCDIVSQQDI